MGHVVECTVDDVEGACAAEGREELFVGPAGGRVLVGQGPEVVRLGSAQRPAQRSEDGCDVPCCVGLEDTPVGKPSADRVEIGQVSGDRGGRRRQSLERALVVDGDDTA
jgi:hypothetical protein